MSKSNYQELLAFANEHWNDESLMPVLVSPSYELLSEQPGAHSFQEVIARIEADDIAEFRHKFRETVTMLDSRCERNGLNALLPLKDYLRETDEWRAMRGLYIRAVRHHWLPYLPVGWEETPMAAPSEWAISQVNVVLADAMAEVLQSVDAPGPDIEVMRDFLLDKAEQSFRIGDGRRRGNKNSAEARKTAAEEMFRDVFERELEAILNSGSGRVNAGGWLLQDMTEEEALTMLEEKLKPPPSFETINNCQDPWRRERLTKQQKERWSDQDLEELFRKTSATPYKRRAIKGHFKLYKEQKLALTKSS